MTDATKFDWAELWLKFMTLILSNKVLTVALVGVITSASTNVAQYFQNEETTTKLKNTEQTAEYLEKIIMQPEPVVKSQKKTIIINNCPDCMKAIEALEDKYHK